MCHVLAGTSPPTAKAITGSVRTKALNFGPHPLLIECYQCHQPTNRNQQFISRVGSMPVRADVADRLNGVKQALAWISVAFVDVPILSLAQVALSFRSQLV